MSGLFYYCFFFLRSFQSLMFAFTFSRIRSQHFQEGIHFMLVSFRSSFRLGESRLNVAQAVRRSTVEKSTLFTSAKL